MPELPEVETVCRSLQQVLIGQQIQQVTVSLPKLIKIPQGDEGMFAQQLQQAKVTAIVRRGKYIIIHLDNQLLLVIHLRMTGKLLYLPSETVVGKHSHLIFNLTNQWDLRFDDVRQFGSIYLVDQTQLSQIGGLATLGLEPLSEDFTLEAFQTLLQGKKQKAKVFLLDQRFVAGIGNIYADEILFQAKVHPLESLANLTDPQDIYDLWAAIIDRLSQGIAYGGSSIKDYVNSFGEAGSFQQYHKVYGRYGKPCIECGTLIEKMTVGGRSTGFCPQCQFRRSMGSNR